MPDHRPSHTFRTFATFALFFTALAALLAAPSLLAAASPAAGPHPVAPPAASAATTPSTLHAGPAGHGGPDGTYTAQGLTSARWDIGAVHADWTHRPIWQAPVTGEGTRIAVIDTGIDPSHPDLDQRIVAWRDFVNGREEPYDDTGHGTHVAGIIAGEGHTQLNPLEPYFFTGARGVAPDADLMAAKVMDEHGEGDPASIAEAIRWSLNPDGDHDPEKAAHIINLSLGIGITTRPENGHQTNPGGVLPSGGSGQMREVEDAIREATKAGAIVVVAAGNHDPHESGEILFPGTMEEVITVGAVDEHGKVAAFSNHGESGSNKPDLVAPGVIISTTITNGGLEPLYKGLGGTSMAAPFVAGTIALMMESDPTLRGVSFHEDRNDHTTAVRGLLKNAAAPVAGAGPHEQGAGLLRVDATLAQVEAGKGELRPAAYAAPFLVTGVSVLLVRRRRRTSRVTTRQLPPRPRAPVAVHEAGASGTATEADATANDRGWGGPHHRPSTPLRPIPVPSRSPGRTVAGAKVAPPVKGRGHRSPGHPLDHVGAWRAPQGPDATPRAFHAPSFSPDRPQR